MDSTTPTSAPTNTTTPFPVGGKPATQDAATKPAQQPDLKRAEAAAPEAGGLLQRLTQRAHDVVDSAADRISSTVDGLQGGVANAGNTRDEWVESAREAIRLHPFAAVGTAVLLGLALHTLSTSRDR